MSKKKFSLVFWGFRGWERCSLYSWRGHIVPKSERIRELLSLLERLPDGAMGLRRVDRTSWKLHGYEFTWEPSDNKLHFATPYLKECAMQRTHSPLLYISEGHNCGSKCPLLRAFQSLLTRLAQWEAQEQGTCDNLAGAESGSSAPDMDDGGQPPESMSDVAEASPESAAEPDWEEEEVEYEEEWEDDSSSSASFESQSEVGEQTDSVSRSPSDSQESEAGEERSSDPVEQSSNNEDAQVGEAESFETRDEAHQQGAGDEAMCLTPAGESQPEPAGGHEAGGSPAASAPSDDGGQASEEEACEARADEQVSTDTCSLDSCPEVATSGAEGSSEVAGLDSSSENSSLWEAVYNPERDQHTYGGGGGQAHALSAEAADAATERQVTYLLQRFFSEIEDLFRKEEGRDRWDAKRVVKAVSVAPQELPASKYKRQRGRQMSFWVDVSGSVSHLAPFIVSLITAACKDHDIQVVIGSEAHPEKVLPSTFTLTRNVDWWGVEGVWEGKYVYEFDRQVELFLKANRLEDGSTIVIWSDYMDIHAVENLDRLARLLKPYKVVWLCSHNGKDPDYRGNESFRLEQFARRHGHQFLWGIDSPQGIREAISKLRLRSTR